jgi:hypothetical protein
MGGAGPPEIFWACRRSAIMTFQSPKTSMPQASTTFDHVVLRLGLSPSQYANSAELKDWVRKHKDEKYVPPRLLELWGFDAETELHAVKKPPERAA